MKMTTRLELPSAALEFVQVKPELYLTPRCGGACGI